MALKGIVDVYVRHAALLRTAVEVTNYDPEFAAFYKAAAGPLRQRHRPSTCGASATPGACGISTSTR